MSAKSVNAVVPLEVGATLAYNANLKAFQLVAKLCVAVKSSVLNEVHIACVIAILYSPYDFC